jgi:DNA-directed RNA polymerase specialized sigma subunit
MTDPNLTTAQYFNELRNKDQQAYESWKSTGDKRHLGALMESLMPVIRAEVKRASGSLPSAALTAEAKKWTIKAIQTYDPSKGSALATHVSNYLQKVRRMNYKYQNAVRLPENLQLKFHDYNHAITSLRDELNRDPTDEELSKKLGWSKPQTVKFKNSLYNDLIESSSEKPGEYTQFNEGAILMEHLMSQLTPEEKIILDNVKLISSTALAEKMGVNVNRLNYLKKNLEKKIMRIKSESGMY